MRTRSNISAEMQNDEHDPELSTPTVKQSGGSIMVWVAVFFSKEKEAGCKSDQWKKHDILFSQMFN